MIAGLPCTRYIVYSKVGEHWSLHKSRERTSHLCEMVQYAFRMREDCDLGRLPASTFLSPPTAHLFSFLTTWNFESAVSCMSLPKKSRSRRLTFHIEPVQNHIMADAWLIMPHAGHDKLRGAFLICQLARHWRRLIQCTNTDTERDRTAWASTWRLGSEYDPRSLGLEV